MTQGKPRRPKPRRSSKKTQNNNFQPRVDYVAKALQLGSWGPRFDACFEHHDGDHLVAVIMLRAEKNEKLRRAIMTSFDVADWNQVPWHETARPFSGKTAREIGVLADQVRKEKAAEFAAIFKNPDLLMSQEQPK